ncbi:MAG: N-acetyl-gamma-glutamyl-phosphate reductase [Rhodobiaceae bacterium]|jgi:N-acetyl-gamma-glutamyl-phosphate reductase|nr:N-acetyl-gamma-glutamyl-phosphate reductase [Rhodobiaceae bacterium]MBT5518425.1 N-acetyl-gamma-glutamyl-phosphate reductase [Rhodobiaceae bacterium]MBT7279831.1 N-acetyl-gamma-glutamyl-phosphate reductase [Rhodobiaceae bacterium]MDG2496504.1 N-acetyl-gamma-glutamyl-phosphate reductase [Alphaproteobacteria bacterium]
MSKAKINVGILGASGYTGADAVRLLAAHPHVEITLLTGNAHADKSLAEIYPQFGGLSMPNLIKAEEADWRDIDAVICGLPHSTAQDVIATIPAHVRIIDMSADFRLRDSETYSQWYGRPHDQAALLSEAVYGLSEHYRDDIQKARLVACPGCYPTAALSALMPLLSAGLVTTQDLIIDAKSGVTGAGRSLKEQNLFSEVAEGMNAYGVGAHRHAPEIEQELAVAAGQDDVRVNFTPHLVPMNRGEYVSIYAKSADGAKAADMKAAWEAFYADKPFVRVVEEAPATRHVRGSNYCLLSAFDDRIDGRVILFSTLDNLVKGSSGQAVQNLNLMFGFDETAGLLQQPLYP